jgi:hypothetical protein
MMEKYITGEIKDKEKEKRILEAVLDNIKNEKRR